MENKDRVLFSIVAFLIAAVCFGIAAYGNFYNGKDSLGILSSISFGLMIMASILRFKKYKDSNKNK